MQTNIKNKTSYAKSSYREIFDVEKYEAKLKVYIKSKLKIYDVILAGKAELEREEFCAAKFTFTVIKDDVVSFNQGDAVSVKFDSTGIFYGYVFSKKRDKKGLIEVVCYDQMRYLKNRRTYTRGKMTLDEVVNTIARDYALKVGSVAKCGGVLKAVAADNVSLLDVIVKACRDTRSLTGERFILYDDGGYLVLKNEKDMTVPVMVDSSGAENFVYKDTIDKDVYNMIEVYSDNKKLNTRTVTRVSDKESIDAWGTLILTKKAVDEENSYNEAKRLLGEYNRINRDIVIKNVHGNEEYRPGCSLYIRLVMGDLALDGYVRVRKAVHIFENNRYSTDIYLDGSEVG